MKHATLHSVVPALLLVSLLAGITPYAQEPAAPIAYIDTHNHFITQACEPCDYTGPVDNALLALETLGVRQFLIMPQPAVVSAGRSYLEIAEITDPYRQQFAFLGGGWTLNPMIQRAVEAGVVSDQVRQRFQDTALDILARGAVGFGEFAVEHFSMADWHPYVSAPANHELFQLLADIAADNNVPIDIHMEAIAFDMPLSEISPVSAAINNATNPEFLEENMTEFEELLDSNENARIVWAHAGWDNTGHRTVERMTGLLEQHDNLYMQIRVLPHPIRLPNRPTLPNGDVDPEWITLIERFPSRFVIGLDSMLDIFDSSQFEPHTDFLNGLPEDLARKVAYENAIRIYNLNASGVEGWDEW